MDEYIKLFKNHTQYETYKNSADYVTPNVSYCEQQDEVHYNPWEDPRLIAIFNITDISSATPIMDSTSQFSEIEIDGVVQPSVVSSYTFSTTGEHVVKYTLINDTSIEEWTFSGCISLTSMTIPNSVASIGDNAFNNCRNLISVIIPDSMTSIGSGAFYGCWSLTSITIPNSVTYIGYSAFRDCSSLTSVTIPNSVTSIGDSFLSHCSGLTSVIIPNSVNSIGNYAFQSCTGLTSVTIPSSVTSIGNGAFRDCSSLISIICNATTAPTIQSSTFRDVETNGTLTVSAGSTGYNTWMGTGNYYLGKYNWTKVEQ